VSITVSRRKRDSKPCTVVYSRFRRFVRPRTNSSRSLHFATLRYRGTFRETEEERETLTARVREGCEPRRFSASMFRTHTYLGYTARGLLARSGSAGTCSRVYTRAAGAHMAAYVHHVLDRVKHRRGSPQPRWTNGKISDDHAGTYLVISSPPPYSLDACADTDGIVHRI